MAISEEATRLLAPEAGTCLKVITSNGSWELQDTDPGGGGSVGSGVR